MHVLVSEGRSMPRNTESMRPLLSVRCLMKILFLSTFPTLIHQAVSSRTPLLQYNGNTTINCIALDNHQSHLDCVDLLNEFQITPRTVLRIDLVAALIVRVVVKLAIYW